MKDFDNLAAYLPAAVLNQVMALPPGPEIVPLEQKFRTVCLFCDVSGFTNLSERLCREGPDGIEELASQLNKYMGQVVKLTSRAGGDVLKFAGDAMFAVWPPDDGDLINQLMRAIQCSLDMQLRLSKFHFVFRNRDADGREIQTERLQGELNIKCGIGIGDVHVVVCGGEGDNIMSERFEYVALGSALEEAFSAEGCAKAGQVIISKQAFSLIKNQLESYETITPPNSKDKWYWVTKVNPKYEVRWKKKAADDFMVTAPSSEVEARVWKHVPAAVLPYLNESNEYWAPELRRVTTLFCALGYKKDDLVNVDAQNIQRIFLAMQQSVFVFEGTVNKFLVDDKGSTLVVVFGLPPFAHENDATRGVLSALSILASLLELGKDGSIGITTGEAFCGVVGTRGNRREYSVIGDSINTAARLMIEAKNRGCGHLMDRSTSLSIDGDLSTEQIGNVLLKGKAHEIPLFQVSGGSAAASMHVARVTGRFHSPRRVDTPKEGFFSPSSPTSPRQKKLSTLNVMPPASPVAAVAPPTAAETKASLKKKKTGAKADQQSLISPDSLAGMDASINSANHARALATAQKSQIAAITEASHLRAIRDAALKTRMELASGRDKAVALAKGLDSFAHASQKGLQMGSGRPGINNEKSPAALHMNKNRTLKAVEITFENCATASEANSKPDELSTRFTLAVVDGIETMYDLKNAALARLGVRKLLRRGPQADRAFFSLKWNENNKDTLITDESMRLDELKDVSAPLIKLLLIEHKDRVGTPSMVLASALVASPMPSHSRTASQVSTPTMGLTGGGADPDGELIKNQLEAVRNTLLWGDRGTIVVLEGSQGVGKTKVAEEVFLRSEVVASVLTGVAMGNPYETERLSSPLSVWTVLLKQFLEEALTFKQIAAGKTPSLTIPRPSIASFELEGKMFPDDPADLSEILKIARSAIVKGDAKYANFDYLDMLVSSVMRTGHLPGIRASMYMEEEPRSRGATNLPGVGSSQLRTMLTTIANLVVGLSLDVAPVVAVVDDSHFMDIASWHLTVRLADAITALNAKVIVVLLHRHLIMAEMFSHHGSNSVGTESADIFAGVDRHNMRAIENSHTRNRRDISRLFEDLLGRDHVLHVEKKPALEKTAQIILETLQVDTVPMQLLNTLKRKSAGNALFIRDALQAYREENLISVKNRTVVLTEEYNEKEKHHELPIPPSVEGICATLLDTMSTTQQIALKVSSVIGETFTLSLVTSVFPLVHLKPGLTDEWNALVRLGVVMEIPRADHTSPTAEVVYTFSNGWMLETLRKRMLGKQRRKLTEIYKLICSEREEATRQKYMEKALNRLTVSASGNLFVRKDHARNMLQPWKKRWVVLEQDELIQYYDETNPKRLEVIKLSSEGTSVSNRPGGFMGLESNFGEKHYPYCFTVHATNWWKKGVEMTDNREFFMATESLQEQSDWVFKLGYQIDFYRMQTKSSNPEQKKMPSATNDFDVYAKSLPKMWGTDSGSHMSNIAGVKKLESSSSIGLPPLGSSDTSSASVSVAGGLLGKLSLGSRKSATLSATNSSSNLFGRAMSRSKAETTTNRAEAGVKDPTMIGTEFQNPGASVTLMTAAHFKSISRDEALATFWASDDLAVEDLTSLHASHHVTWFYEFGDMAIVSLNGQGAIDGYLLGFVSGRTPDHAVIHQCAVIPMVRRLGIATKLYTRFFEMAKKRGCRWVRSLVPRDSLGAMAFHRALGFDELGGEDFLATDMIVFIRELKGEVMAPSTPGVISPRTSGGN